MRPIIYTHLAAFVLFAACWLYLMLCWFPVSAS